MGTNPLSQPLAIIVDPGRPGLERFAATTGSAGMGGALESLARAIASDSGWSGSSPVIVVHPSRAVLAVVGRFSPGTTPFLRAQAEALPPALSTGSYVPFDQVRADCGELAQRLVDTLGPTELARRRFVGVPRGGLIVLGLLSYILKLRPEQLTDRPRAADRIVIVDDCAFTGYRLGRVASALRFRESVIACLYAPAPLCAAGLTIPRVTGFVAARDTELPGAGPDPLPVLPGERYWTGRTAHVAFPWGEPDRMVWDPGHGRWETGWPIFPPELCLKAAATASTARVQLQPPAAGPLRPPDSVLFGDLGEEIVVTDLESGATVCLEETAAEIWRAVIASGTPDAAVSRLTSRYDVDPGQAGDDCSRILSALQERGFLL